MGAGVGASIGWEVMGIGVGGDVGKHFNVRTGDGAGVTDEAGMIGGS